MTEDATLSSFQDSEGDADTGKKRADTSDEQASTGKKHANTDEKPTNADKTESMADAAEEELIDTNADAEPAISTYVWGTYTCDDCGETVARAWREDEGLVCPSCKEW